jgi:hypothetical protein
MSIDHGIAAEISPIIVSVSSTFTCIISYASSYPPFMMALFNGIGFLYFIEYATYVPDLCDAPTGFFQGFSASNLYQLYQILNSRFTYTSIAKKKFILIPFLDVQII